MSGGAYIALSGLRTRLDQLDLVASDIANSGTAGYKSVRTSTMTAERDTFNADLQAAIDVTSGPEHVDFRSGSIMPTGRDLDMAIDGPGFFVLETTSGPRYTRNGHFMRMPDGTLAAADGSPVESDGGQIRLGTGEIRVAEDGTVMNGTVPAGKVRIVVFDETVQLTRDGSARFKAPEDASPDKANAIVRGRALEQSNVSIFERMAQLTEVSRDFESLQRAIQVMFNDIDGRTITELGRR